MSWTKTRRREMGRKTLAWRRGMKMMMRRRRRR